MKTLTSRLKVSCFGSDGDGDIGDDWQVVCKKSGGDGNWHRGKNNLIYLKNKQAEV